MENTAMDGMFDWLGKVTLDDGRDAMPMLKELVQTWLREGF